MTKIISQTHRLPGVFDLCRSHVAHVAQIFNLLYRRVALGRALDVPATRVKATSADCKSAIQQSSTLRYRICAARLMAALLMLATLGPLTSRSAEGPAIVSRGPHSREWQQTFQETLPNGRVRTRTSGFTELASGMHRLDAQTGQWVDSSDQLEIFQDGAVGRQTAHTVIFAPNANTIGAIDLLTPGGQRLRSHVLGIAVFEPRTGDSEMLASLKNSVGELHPPNVVIYPDAFDGVRADLRYTHRIGGFSQDVILAERLVLPQGWEAATVLIQVWTEFEAPAPGIAAGTRAGMADDTISFGTLQTGDGQAFALGEENERGSSVPVVKRWVNLGLRSFLVESVRYSSIKPYLDKLPAAQARAEPRPGQGPQPVDVCPFPTVPPTRQARANKPAETFRTASISFPSDTLSPARSGGEGRGEGVSLESAQTAPTAKPNAGVAAATPRPSEGRGIKGEGTTIRLPLQRGYVIDYTLSSSLSNFTFQGDTTYVASNTVTFTGTTTFEGNCVVKFAKTNTATLKVGTSVWNTGPYRPAIFTAVDDNTVGEAIGTGTPSGYYGGNMLEGSFGLVHDIRISYASTGMRIGALTLRHAQFVHCNTAIDFRPWSGAFTNENVLFYDIGTLHYGQAYMSGSHLTINQCTNFAAGGASSGQLLNSLIIGLINWGDCEPSQTSCDEEGQAADVFQSVGAARHYLAANSVHRNAGSTLSGTLADDIRQRTTYPPVVIQPTSIYTNSLVLSPQAQRDTDALDLGYHYDPLDYAMSVVALQDASITILPGTAVALFSTPPYSYAIALLGGASLISEGSATMRNRLVRYNTVQEQANTNWISSAHLNIFTDGWTVSPTPQARFRFTDWSVLGGGPFHFEAQSQNDNAYVFKDCEFHGGNLISWRPNMAFTNCLFNRVTTYLDDNVGDYNTIAHIHNSTFHGGQLSLYHYNTALWAFTDNLFDDTTLVQDGAVTNDYNAYTTNLVATRVARHIDC